MSVQSKRPKIAVGSGDLAIDVAIVCLVYSSFEGEVMAAKVKKCTEHGIIGMILAKHSDPAQDRCFHSWQKPTKRQFPVYLFLKQVQRMARGSGNTTARNTS